MIYISTFVSKFHKLFLKTSRRARNDWEHNIIRKKVVFANEFDKWQASSNKYTRKKKSDLMFSYIKIQLLGQFITLFQFYFYNKYERKPD